MELIFTVMSDSSANNNGSDGISATYSNLIHNVAEFNGGFGMFVNTSLYGSNVLLSNNGGGPDIQNIGGTSQNNNLCSSGPC